MIAGQSRGEPPSPARSVGEPAQAFCFSMAITGISDIATVDIGVYEQPTDWRCPQSDTAHIDFPHAFYIAQCDRRAVKLVAQLFRVLHPRQSPHGVVRIARHHDDCADSEHALPPRMNRGHVLNPEQLDALHRSIEDPLAASDSFRVDLKLDEFDLQIRESDGTKHQKCTTTQTRAGMTRASNT